MNRRTAVEAFNRSGTPVLGVLAGRYPRELPLALGMAGVEVWDPPALPKNSGQHLQPFVCSVIHHSVQLLLDAQGQVAAWLYPHLCDSMQNLFTVARDGMGITTPAAMFYPPRAGAAGDGAIPYVAQQLKELAQALASVGRHAATDETMAAAVTMVGQCNDALAALYARRAQGSLSLSNTDFYALARLWEYQTPHTCLEGWRDAARTGVSTSLAGPRVVLSGLLPDRGVLKVLDQRQVAVVEDDLLACGRRLIRTGYPAGGDPWEAAGRATMALPPCSSVASSIDARGRFLEELVTSSNASAIVFHTVKFCEMELFDHPFLVRWLKEREIPTLLLESQLHQGDYGQVETRLDAFLEMLP
jgi:benzoyl-CoA reductase/2-hydroxyglutaryl-CoA dehydratase subunit BcrC/BadD/HgdB